MKKLLSLIVAAVLVLSMLPMGAMAEAVQKALSTGRTQTIAKPTEGVKAPGENKAPEKPSYREESTLYSFGFENDPAEEGWTFFDLDGNGTNWAQSTTKKHDGYYSLMSSSYKPTSHNVDNWALTPAIELPATGMAALKFWIAQQSSSYPETWALYIGEVADPDQMAVLQADTTEGGSTFIQKEYDISEYLGKTVYIAFVNHNCNDKYYIYIDDVEIVADPEGVPVTPTPAPTEVPAGYLDDALNAEDTELELTFVSGGTYPWIVMTDEADRVYAMSGNKGVHNSTSMVTATFTLDSPHQLSFDYMAWGEGASYDKCIFSLDGTVIFTKGAENQPWQNYVVETPLEAGEHTIGFAFTKDGSDNGTGDYFKVDNVKLADASSITPTPAPTEVPANYLDDAMNAADTELTIHFESTGTYPWIVLTEGDRVYAQSGNKGVHSTSSTVTATFTLEGYYLLSFDYMAWGEGSSTIWDKCIFKLDGAVIFTKGAENQPWQNYAVEEPLEPGEHTIEFTFTKDSSANGTGDYFNIDNVKLEETAAPTPTPELDYGYYFESQDDADTWLYVDADGDGYCWEWSYGSNFTIYEGEGIIASASYDNNVGALTPDNWAISPEAKVLGENSFVSMYLTGQDPSYYAEHFGLYVGSGTDVANYTEVANYTLTSGRNYTRYIIALGEYAGETVNIAVRHYGCTDMFWLDLDAVEFFGCEEGESIAKPTTRIEDVELFDLTAPAWNASPDFELTVPNDALYQIETVEWYKYVDANNSTLLDAESVFDDAQSGYYAVVYLAPAANCKFSPEVTATLDGSSSYVNNVQYLFGGSECAVVLGLYYVEEISTELIEDINVIGMTEPVFGEAPDCEAEPANSDDPYTVSLVEWYCDDELMEEGELFDNADAEYHAIIYLYANEGYEFAEVPAVLVNGSDEFVVESAPFNENAAFGIVWGNFTVEPEVVLIDEVNVEGFIEPAWGEAPFYGVTVPEGANYTIELVEWYDNNAIGAMAPTDVFDNEDTTYSIYVEIVPDEGYEFSESLVMLINGEETFVDPEYSAASAEGAYIWSIEFTVERELIDAIEITELDIPEWGANPDFEVVVPEGAPYGIHYVIWYLDGDEPTELGAGSVFDDAAAEYFVEIRIDAADGYKFADSVTATLNDGTELILSNEVDTEENCVYVESIRFTVEAPIIWGDADGDGELTTADALLLMRCLINADTVDEENLAWCDVNGDGTVTLADALLIMRKAMNTIETFPVE